MIITITLNPAVDLLYCVENIVFDSPLRSSETLKAAGGKGINVSAVCAKMKFPTTALAILGGYTGKEFTRLIKQKGIDIYYTTVSGETRQNVVITGKSDSKRIKINAAGPTISAGDFVKFERLYKKHLKTASIAVISGKLPPGLPEDTYAMMVYAANKSGVPVILDTEGAPLEAAFKYKPKMIKPNKEELEGVVNYKISSDEELAAAAKSIIEKGVEIVVVSDGEKRCFVFSEKEAYYAEPPVKSRLHAVGAGDSLAAGMASSFFKKKKLADAFKTGIAFGNVSALTPYPELFDEKLLKDIIAKVKISNLS